MSVGTAASTLPARAAPRVGRRGGRWVGRRGGRWVGLGARLGLGATFAVAGLLKVSDPQASVRAVHAYQLLPYGASQLLGFALPWLEIGLAVLLLLGLLTRVAAVGLSALLLAFIAAMASAWARGLSIDCGCFGGGGAVPEGQAAYLPELLRDGGLLLVGLWLVWRPATPFAVEATRGSVDPQHARDETAPGQDPAGQE